MKKFSATVRGVAIIGLVAAGLAAGSAQRSVADTAFGTVTINSPQNHAVLGEASSYGYGSGLHYTYNKVVQVDASATGSDQDPPARIRFFLDNRKDPIQTVGCPTSGDCEIGWHWDGQRLFGWHTLTAEAVMSDPLQQSVRSEPVRVFWRGLTHMSVHRDRHATIHRTMVESGRVTNLSAGHRAVPQALIKLVIETNTGHHIVKVRTNAHGDYHARFRATKSASVTASVVKSRRYLPTIKAYLQQVHARPICRLSKRRVRVRHPAILTCTYPHLPASTRFHVQNRIRGRWVQGKLFYATHAGHTKLYITPFKRRTLVLREWFDRTPSWAASPSNAVRLYVR